MSTALDSITIEDFKNKYIRDFNYLPIWKNDANYFAGDKVFYDTNKTFYLAKINNIGVVPTTITTWLITQDNVKLYVSDLELQNALDEAKTLINISLKFPSQDFLKKVFLTLVAHILYVALNGAGMQAGNGLFETSTSVGNVSQSYTIPPYMLKSPLWLQYSKSPYGVEYFTLIYPYLNIASLSRIDTKPR
jgi:hypothetical protein